MSASPPCVVRRDHPVTLVGGGPVPASLLARAARIGPPLVAADGGADTLLAAGHRPEAVIGDFDSLSAAARSALRSESLHHVAEQDSTDFEKCLTRIDAPLICAVGFAGGRMDHLLAVFNALVRHPARRALVIGAEDACLLAPPVMGLDLPRGTAVSLFPMGGVRARSVGLHWPVDGLALAPDGRIGTSNRADGPVTLTAEAPKLLLILPLAALETVAGALLEAPRWP